MLEFNDKNLDHVLRHFEEGKMKTSEVIGKFMASHPELDKKEKRRSLFWSSVCSGIAAVLLLGFFLWNHLDNKMTIYETGEASAEFVLPDQSKVVLYEDSRLEFRTRHFGRKTRTVGMEGRVFFAVTRDEVHPFIIEAGPGKVSVLGTQFEVTADDSTAIVQVLDGKVNFASPDAVSSDQGLILTAGMKAHLHAGDLVPELEPEADPNVFAWKTHRFIFKQTSLARVLETLSDYYGVDLDCREKDKLLTAEFETESIDMIIRMIEMALNVEISLK